ncbi:MAG: type I 3-dehydroquinate dehydratase [Planctomycetes bacterium]|nr:type I 3-dehydroquinate dehydratase [Planctomycetota bacterium]
MLCISIKATSFSGLMEKLQLALKEKPDFIELRADGIPDFDIKRIPKTGRTRLIFTCRSKNNIRLLQSAIDSGRFDYVDVAFEDMPHIKRGLPKIIASYHDFKETPSLAFLKRLHKQMAETRSDVIKIVTYANDILDNLKIFNLLKHTKDTIPTTAFCMGEAGLSSRVLYRRFGGWMSYASLNNAEGTAEGQLDYHEMKYNYQADKINNKTRVFGLIGNPVKYSLSPVLFNGLFKRYKMNAVYLPFLIHNIKVLPELMRALDIRALSVTMPFKEKVIRNSVVNTIYRDKKGGFICTNTDGRGAILALGASTGSVQDKQILILGAGGAGRAIAHELINNGARVTIANRHYDKAVKAARDLGCKAIQWHKIKETMKQTDILINATPVGMMPKPNAAPIPAKLLHKGLAVMDTIYRPPETKLLRQARAKVCRIISGLEMFINQAGLQFALFQKLATKAPRH